MNIIIFGVGPHAKRIHLKHFQNSAYIDKVIVVDLKGQEARLKKTLDAYHLDYELVLADPTNKNDDVIDPSVAATLREKIQTHDIEHAVIVTEPKAHKMYIDFCLEEGLSLVCDKPLTTPVFPNTVQGAEQILSDYNEILEKFEASKSTRFDVMTQRRSHEGFLKVFETVSEVVQKYGVPVTKIKVFHEDGNWPMPNEVINRENHPYKYGYGKLMHSGYHFLDLVSMFMEVNKNANLDYTSREVLVADYRHSDFMTYFNEDFYRKLSSDFGFAEDVAIFDHLHVFENFGELDVSAIVNFKNEDGRIMTQAILDMAQASFSRRAWFNEPEDTYKGNGRLRHEFLEVNVGPLLNVKILSFQSREIHEEKGMRNEIGALDHFEVDIFRNSALIGGQPFERILIEPGREEDNYIGQNEQAKFDVLDKFFRGEPSLNGLAAQKDTVELLTEVYKTMAQRYPERHLYRLALTVAGTDTTLTETVNVTDSIEDSINRAVAQQFGAMPFTYRYGGYRFEEGVLVYQYDIQLLKAEAS